MIPKEVLAKIRDVWTIPGILLGLLGLASTWLTLVTDPTKYTLVSRALAASWLPVVALGVVGLSLLAIWQTRDYAKIAGELRQIKKERENAKTENGIAANREPSWIPYIKPEPERPRWEEIRNIRFGHINYYPLLYYDQGTKPTGLGIDYLKKLLRNEVKITSYSRQVNWKEAFELLKIGEFDIVATPLFATFTRSKDAAFSMPLFFSNVGLFASKKLMDRLKLTEPADLGTVLKAINRQKTSIKFVTVDEEISEHLGRKHSLGEVYQHPAKTDLSTLFAEIEESSKSENDDLVIFSESFTAWINYPAVKTGEIVNLLKPHQILYPVCFALRRCDYQLANLINIRLLEVAEVERGGVLADLAKRLVQKHDEIKNVQEVYEHFVARWPVNSACQISVSSGDRCDSMDDGEQIAERA